MGLFSRAPKDPKLKKNVEKLKEFKKLAMQKQYAKALRSGTEYLKKVPHNHEVLFVMGGIYYMQDMHRAALSYFDRALEIGSYDVDALLLKAYSHHKLGEDKRAMQCCKKIREIDPKNNKVSELLEQLDL